MKLDISGAKPFIDNWDAALAKSEAAYRTLTDGSGAGSEMTGWLIREQAQGNTIKDISDHAASLRESSDTVLVIGIGGSYLGAKALVELLPNNGKLIFVGNTLSGAYYDRVINSLEGKDFSIIVVSKSGTTTEPAVGFRIFERLLLERYGSDGAKRHVAAVTNPVGGALRKICDAKGYTMLTIPDSVGGRYSVFSAAGLLPLSVAGIDITALLSGTEHSAEVNAELAIKYAAIRQALYSQGKKIEVLSCWEPTLRWVGEWYKQLFGESEGKDGKGIFPVSLEMTADLHSMGQYMQDGERHVFETFLWSSPSSGAIVPITEDDFDGFNNVAGRRLDELNRIALEATKAAHIEGRVPAIEIVSERLDAFSAGELLYFFMLSCGISGYIEGVNPFDQPGVEAYKKKMKALL
jgi:glucose-6-phosphate isomerase